MKLFKALVVVLSFAAVSAQAEVCVTETETVKEPVIETTTPDIIKEEVTVACNN